MSSTAKLSMSAVLLSKSDHQAFAKLESTYHKQIQPASAIALTLFNQLVLAAWNMERTQRLEATLSLQSDPLLDLTHTPVLARIATCRLRAERTFSPQNRFCKTNPIGCATTCLLRSSSQHCTPDRTQFSLPLRLRQAIQVLLSNQEERPSKSRLTA